MNLERFAGDPQGLMAFAAEGHLTKTELAELLAPERRAAYLRRCAVIEKTFTEACTAQDDPCLESGCSLEGEVCLQPLLNAEPEYLKACAAEWMRMMQS